MNASTDLFALWQSYEREALAARQAYQAAIEAGQGDFDALRRAFEVNTEKSHAALLAFLNSITSGGHRVGSQG